MMGKIEEKKVEEILDEILVKYPVSDYPYRRSINEWYAKEICQLFPKSPDNPDGHEPKSTKQKLDPPPRFDEVYIQGANNMDAGEPKPDESIRIIKGTEHPEEWSKLKPDTTKAHFAHCYQGEYVDSCKYGNDEDCPAKRNEGVE